METSFDHEKLDVYQDSIHFVSMLVGLIRSTFPSHLKFPHRCKSLIPNQIGSILVPVPFAFINVHSRLTIHRQDVYAPSGRTSARKNAASAMSLFVSLVFLLVKFFNASPHAAAIYLIWIELR